MEEAITKDGTPRAVDRRCGTSKGHL